MKILHSLFISFILFALLACQPKEITSGKIYLRNRNWPKAIEQLEAAVKAYPGNAEAHFLLGETYGLYERYDDMLREFETSLQLSDKFATSITAQREHYWIQKYNTGIKAQDAGDLVIAERALLTAIKLAPHKQEGHKKLALNYLKTNQVDKAFLLYRELLERNPDDIELLASLANLYYSQARYAETIDILRRLLTMDPENRDGLANLALCYDAMGDVERAHKAFLYALKANPQDKDLTFLFAVHHYNRKNYDDAISYFQRVLELVPNDFASVSNIGNTFLSIAEEIKKDLKQSNGTGPSPALFHLKTRVIDNYRKAIPYLKQALEMEPNHPRLWQNLGIAYVNTGEIEKGEQAFLRSEDLKIKLHN